MRRGDDGLRKVAHERNTQEESYDPYNADCSNRKHRPSVISSETYRVKADPTDDYNLPSLHHRKRECRLKPDPSAPSELRKHAVWLHVMLLFLGVL